MLHNRYRTTGGEERVVGDLLALVREQLGEDAQLLARDSDRLSRSRAAAGLLRGGLAPDDVARAVRVSRARVVHAHNLHPSLGWRALAAARDAGARIVLHLHNYRLVCAVGVCFTRGAECTRCHGRDTLPGVRLNCRGSGAEAGAYAAALALWQRRLVAQADAVVVPSEFARERLRSLGAPLPWDRLHVIPPPVRDGGHASQAATGRHALVASRLTPEKGVDIAIEACRAAGLRLVVAGDGPERQRLAALANGADVRFAGLLEDGELAELRGSAAIALMPSRSAETFGLAAAEAMADGVPVLASRIGALPELVEEEGLVPPGGADALKAALQHRWGDAAAGDRGRALVAGRAGPAHVAELLGAVYDGSSVGRARS